MEYYTVDSEFIYHIVKVDMSHISPASIMTPPNMNLWKENMMLY